MAMRLLGRPYFLAEVPPGIAGLGDKYHTMVQYFPGTTLPLFLHRNCWKWRPGSLVPPDKGRSWTTLVHSLPNTTFVSDKAMDKLFWKCSVSIDAKDGALLLFVKKTAQGYYLLYCTAWTWRSLTFPINHSFELENDFVTSHAYI